MKTYLSGPITSEVPGFTRDQLKRQFYHWENILTQDGEEVVNPLKVPGCDSGDCGPFDGHTWECWLKNDLRALLDCDSIFLLKNWHLSRGALLEFDVAVRCGMEVRFQ